MCSLTYTCIHTQIHMFTHKHTHMGGVKNRVYTEFERIFFVPSFPWNIIDSVSIVVCWCVLLSISRVILWRALKAGHGEQKRASQSSFGSLCYEVWVSRVKDNWSSKSIAPTDSIGSYFTPLQIHPPSRFFGACAHFDSRYRQLTDFFCMSPNQ